MKPIHKFNNSRGATLCNTCSIIITTGLTENLYCDKCKLKQETLREAAENKKNLYYYKQVMNPYPVEEYSHTAYEKGFIEGYQESTKWQQDKMYNNMEEYATFILKCYKENLPLLLAKEWFE